MKMSLFDIKWQKGVVKKVTDIRRKCKMDKPACHLRRVITKMFYTSAWLSENSSQYLKRVHNKDKLGSLKGVYVIQLLSMCKLVKSCVKLRRLWAHLTSRHMTVTAKVFLN